MEDRILKEKKIRRELDLLLRTGEVLVARDGNEFELKAQGWNPLA